MNNKLLITLLILITLYVLYPFRPIVIENKSILNNISTIIDMEIDGIEMFYPVIIVDDINDITLINHEKIHFYQMRDSLPIVYHIMYLGYYIRYRLSGMNSIEAYLNLCFEKEAYDKENDLNYLKTRIPFTHFIYLSEKR
jgi:hypothetical protein